MDNIYYKVQLKKGRETYSNFGQEENRILQQPNDSSRYRLDYADTEEFTLYLISYNKSHIKSKKIFKKFFEQYIDIFKIVVKKNNDINKNETTKMNRFMHNIITLSAQSIQELQYINKDKTFSKCSLDDSLHYFMKNEPETLTGSIKTIFKQIYSLNQEVEVFKILQKQEYILEPKEHTVHKVIMGTFYKFFPSFTDSNVIVNVKASQENAYFDYKTFTVALFYLIDNASKYILENTDFDVIIKRCNDELSIEFDMISLKIDECEKDKIYEENYSGQFARKKNLNGYGLGLSVFKLLLEKNNISTKLLKGERSSSDPDYENNIFELKIPTTEQAT